MSLPLIARDVEVLAQRPPHVTGFHTGLDGLGRGPPADLGQDVVDNQGRPPHRAELGLDELMEFRQTHATNLVGRLVAHPYRIDDAGDTAPG